MIPNQKSKDVTTENFISVTKGNTVSYKNFLVKAITEK